jgi:GntR family transcriptional repressor for pyruvate dehydrogenase complex
MRPIEKQSTVDLATEMIIRFLKSGELEIGDKLPTETVMCQRLNISRTTIREAYRKLQSLGYIEIKNGRGAFVKNREQDVVQEAISWFRGHSVQMNDYLQVRINLDPLAAQLAARNRSNSDINHLRDIQAKFETAIADGDNKTMAKLDAEFHENIVLITNNELLIALVRIVNYYFEQLRQTSFKLQRNAINAIEPHRLILEAITESDEVKAAQESINHMLAAYNDLCGSSYSNLEYENT